LLTRDTDVNLGLQDRAVLAKDNQARVFVAIHFNSYHDASAQGTEMWVHKNASEDSRLLATCVQQRLVAALGLRDRGVKAENYDVLRPDYHNPGTAVCLAEVSFLSDPAEEERLGDDGYKDQIAQALAAAITEYIENMCQE